MAKPKLLSTKMLDTATATAVRRHMDLYEQEFINIMPLLMRDKREEVQSLVRTHPAAPLVFTSSHAVAVFSAIMTHTDLNDRRVFCLSGRTRTMLEDPSYHCGGILATAPDAASLARTIMDYGAPKLLFICGNQRRDELPRLLRAAGKTVLEAVVYKTVELRSRFTREVDGILFFSPSAARSFFAVNTLAPRTVCFAIGGTTAGTLATLTSNRIITAGEPSVQALLAAARAYFDQPNTNE